uniref:NDR1/HIN1-like protein 1 n=1 Tax=Erigeron canadensis TaxID=72917 RepID=UPI001CB93DCC|nr:NDR1/HIN1-like protein 1 [Erigeron canadensis]
MTEKKEAPAIIKNDFHRKLYLHGAYIFGALVVAILFIVFLIYLVLKPTKPQFTLQDITLNAFNVTSATTLTSNFQVTLSSRNPNARVGIYYDKIDIYASYRRQQITLPTMLPASYQGHKDVTIWSPYLFGNDVPMAPDLAVSLNEDETAGTVPINIKAIGRVRFKVGTYISPRYMMNVNCPTYITFGSNNNGGYAINPAVKYALDVGCTVEV